MPAKDVFHQIVISALKKDGWTIINDPLFLKLSRQTEFFIDLAADKLLIVERQKNQIAVEIKSFIGRSTIAEFHMAVGQYLNYRLALQKVGSARVLYLAVPQDTYREFFADSFVEEAVEQHQLKLIVFNPKQEEIVLWKH
ncbi:MAG: element excision factor XisH family protein [Tychonema bourrellyi B0820]|uniref:Fatty-acid oxidation protein subunit alpha n=1 Tax=Tychonema bourrellyi FEM_GT703 TaxID=2040638 RepID=A0A2G4EZQ1_9CYAN|nr:element excision factor XisH family protein [Tychonema bourrellyi]MDQ2097902.1 element excision factor XisH family protein [Tychonema bourrellyi B0820]PHX54985.1 fatty-acid oxidation protein subunit alpha [Tychonema bourrellyi FEM_GT703]